MVGANDTFFANLPDRVRPVVVRMRDQFLAPYAVMPGQLGGLAPRFVEIDYAFRTNLNATITVVSVPFEMARSNVIEQKFQRIAAAELIRSGARPASENQLYDPREHEKHNNAGIEAASQLKTWMLSDDGRIEMIEKTARDLIGAGGHERMSVPAEKLLLQGVTGIWTAFEVVARDCVEARLNLRPEEVKRLLEHPDTKRRFENARLSLTDLAEFGFDLSGRMGTYVVGKQDMSDFTTIRAVYDALFPRNELFVDEATVRSLLILNAQRNLIVHRGGKMDDRYLGLTKRALPIGATLRVTPTEFESLLEACLTVGAAMITLAAS